MQMSEIMFFILTFLYSPYVEHSDVSIQYLLSLREANIAGLSSSIGAWKNAKT